MRPRRSPFAAILVPCFSLILSAGCVAGPSPAAGPAGAREGEFTETTGAEPTSGIVLPDVQRAAVQVQLHLGPSDLRSSPIAVILEWYTEGTDCAIALDPRIVSRSGRGRPTTSGSQAGDIIPNDDSNSLLAPAAPNEKAWKPYILALRKDSDGRVGESLVMEFSRNGGSPLDTCESDLVITGVRYASGIDLTERPSDWFKCARETVRAEASWPRAPSPKRR